MVHRIIRRVQVAHCKRGPDSCRSCRESSGEAIALLELHRPGSSLEQRRIIEVAVDGERSWWEYEIATTFASDGEAWDYAREHGIEDLDL